jgi:hypothetical protein
MGARSWKEPLIPYSTSALLVLGRTYSLASLSFPFLYSSRYLIWAWAWQKESCSFSANFSAGKTGFKRQAGLKSDLGGVVGPQSGLCCPPGKNSIKKYYVLHKDDIQAEAP